MMVRCLIRWGAGGAAAAMMLAGWGCASHGWERPASYTDSAAEAAAHARQLAEAERKALRLVERGTKADDRGDHDEAVRLYMEAIDTYANLGIAWHNLGVALLAKQEREQAWKCFSRAAEIDPVSPEPLFNMGAMLQENNLPEQAKRYHLEALERAPSYLPALRESIRIDREMVTVNEDTLERIRRALMIETDPVWRDYMQRTQLWAMTQRERGG